EVGNILKTPTPSLISPFIRGETIARFSLFLFDLRIMSYFVVYKMTCGRNFSITLPQGEINSRTKPQSKIYWQNSIAKDYN
ncbi:hypothetical protein L0152_15480, partial [bacterium]|nr:hypothetical protein [bacterium]